MKTIKPMDVRQTDFHDLKPGDLVAEGIVLDVHKDSRMFVVPSGLVAVDPGDKVPVYAKITPTMLEIVQEANQARQAR